MDNYEKILQETFSKIQDAIYDYQVDRQLPSEWTEENVYLGSDISRYQGYFKYERSPYTREIIDNLSATNSTEMIAVMKCAQCGVTQGVIIPGICWIIAQEPAPILFMAGDKGLVKNSIETRLDPIIQSSGISHLIRPNAIKKKNARTGDTTHYKEFAGGQLIAEGTNNPNKMRQFSVKYIFADDWEAAPLVDKEEGSIRKLIEGRCTSYGNVAKKFYISTPKIEQTSNILPVYEMGDKRKWHWECPHCQTYIPVEWRIETESGSYAGIQYIVDEKGILDEKSVHYRCQKCDGKIYEKQKCKLNTNGKWIPTAKPLRPFYKSYHINAIILPLGFVSWVDLVHEWLEACPPSGIIDIGKLKTFKNVRLGQAYREKGETPRVTDLMKNTRNYSPSIVPDETCKEDGNGEIVMLTLACDLNGIMEHNNEDVRLDWELVAHSQKGVTYSVDHGSIGTFKRNRDKTTIEKQTDGDREKWTYHHHHPNSVWSEFETIMRKDWVCESGTTKNVAITVVDTGFFTRLANEFIDSINDILIVGVKGSVENSYRSLQKDTKPVRQSRENNNLYILEVNQLKDKLSNMIKSVKGADGYQPEGFMNFPQPEQGKYTLNNYFIHYEGEKRVEDIKNGTTVGFKWEKRSNNSLNHFWDVRIYNLAAVYIYLDIIVKSEPKLKNLDWSDFVDMLGI